MAEKDIVVPELDGDGRITAESVIEQIGEIAAEAVPPLDVSGGHDGAVQIGGAYSLAPEMAPGARVHADLGIAIGAIAEAGDASVAIGGPALGELSVAVGVGEVGAEGQLSTAVGGYAQATDQLTTALGGEASATSAGATALGYGTKARGKDSVAIGVAATALNDYDFTLGTKTHNVNVPGTLSVQEPTEPQHAATREYVDGAVASAGGGDWVAELPFTPPADWEYSAATFWVANPGGISLIEVSASIPAGSAGEEHEFTLDWDALSPHVRDLITHVGGSGVAILTGIDENTLEPTPVVLATSANLTLTPLADHGLLGVYGTLLLPARRGSLD